MSIFIGTVPTAMQTILGVLWVRGGRKRAKLLPRLQNTCSARAGNRAAKLVIKLFIALDLVRQSCEEDTNWRLDKRTENEAVASNESFGPKYAT